LKRKRREKQTLLKFEEQQKGCTSGLEEAGVRQGSGFLEENIMHSEANVIVHFPFYADNACLTQGWCCV